MKKFKKLIICACFGLLLAPSAAWAFSEGFQYAVTGAARGPIGTDRFTVANYTLNDSFLQFLGDQNGDGTHIARVELNGINAARGEQASWEFFFSYNPAQLNTGTINLSTVPGSAVVSGAYLQTGTAVFPNPQGNYVFAQHMDSKVHSNGTRLSIWYGAFKEGYNVRAFAGDYHLTLSRTGEPIPEPMTMSLLAAGLLGGAMRKRKTSSIAC